MPHEEMDVMPDSEPTKSLEARFRAGASLQEGISGQKPIDTEFENTSQATIESPRNESAPIEVSKYDYPHRMNRSY